MSNRPNDIICHGANKDNLGKVITRRLLRLLSDTPDI